MHIIKRYPHALRAQMAADELNAHGINATVVGGMLEVIGPYTGWSAGTPHGVAITSKDDAARALVIIQELESTTPDDGWEHQSTPDLTRLDPALSINCPHCHSDVRTALHTGICPQCAEPFDPVDLIVQQHGPDALANCYDEPLEEL